MEVRDTNNFAWHRSDAEGDASMKKKDLIYAALPRGGKASERPKLKGARMGTTEGRTF